MQNITNNLKLLIPANINLLDMIQILIIFVLLFYIIGALKDTRAWILVKGLGLIALAYLVFYACNMTVLQTILQSLVSVFLIAIVLMFQPELQRFVEKIGTNNILTTLKNIKKEKNDPEFYSEDTINEIVQACEKMSEVKTGALIVLERKVPLNEYIDTGIKIKAEVTNQLLINTFEKNTPLHDGAVIIKDELLDSATCYLPLSSSKGIKKSLGTRHRAAIGLSESTDAVVIVVSEETGSISVCHKGKIKEGLTRLQLYDYLMDKSRKLEKNSSSTKNKQNINWIEKSLILIVSICLWAVVANVTDPLDTKIISNIPVAIKNVKILDKLEQTYEVISGSEITIEVTAHKSQLTKITKDLIEAEADVSEMSIVNAIPIKAKIKDNIQGEIKILSDSIMKLQLEELIQAEFPITVEIVKNPSDNLFIADTKTETKSVLIKGSKTIINTIDKVVAKIDASRLVDSGEITAPIVVYDKNENQINLEKIKLSNTELLVYLGIWNTKTIPLDVKLERNSKLILKNYEVEEINVAADDNILENLSKINVTIEADELELDQKEFLINLTLYLPENVYLANNQKQTVTINMELEER